MVHKDVTIEIDYGSRFEERVVDRDNPDPLVGMKIKVGDTYVLGDETHASKDSMATNLTVQLESTEKILDGEKAVVEYMNGPTWLVFEPESEETIKITGCATIEGVRNPDDRLSIDESAVVKKHVWIKELIETAEEFYKKVVESNPGLEGDERLERLQSEITTAKERADLTNAE